MKVTLAQINPIVGDLKGNSELIKSACCHAAAEDSNLIVTPELSLWGYPPQDLLLQQELITQQKFCLDNIHSFLANEFEAISILVGIAEPITDNRLPELFNSIAIINAEGWKVIARKQLLPTYDVFDEKRYFRSYEGSGTFSLNIGKQRVLVGVTICEDLWVEEALQEHRIEGPDPIENLIPKSINLLINLSASPFTPNKESLRKQLAKKAIKRLKCPLIYLNQIGGNDELIFDGGSFAMNSRGETILKLPKFQEAIESCTATASERIASIEPTDPLEDLFKALVLGVKDYALKCGFSSAVLGLSGGIDSALVAVIATAALSSSKITSVLMPSPWSSKGSIHDAKNLANRLGVATHIIPIQLLMREYDSSLEYSLGKKPEGLTSENLQSRIRGTLLMAFSNQENHLLLSTGNKSELAVGYCTLYGDMNGGLSVIGDLYKSCVYELCLWLDSEKSLLSRAAFNLPLKGDLIGKEIISKPPSAELRPDQLDTDSLPDYEILDPILKSFIENKLSVDELCKKNFDQALISKVQQLLKNAEFKRRQAPPVLKVSNQAFGSGWRIPIATK